MRHILNLMLVTPAPRWHCATIAGGGQLEHGKEEIMRLITLLITVTCLVCSCHPQFGPGETRDTVYFPYVEDFYTTPSEVHVGEPVTITEVYSAQKNPWIFSDPELGWTRISGFSSAAGGRVIVLDGHTAPPYDDPPGNVIEYEWTFTEPQVREYRFGSPSQRENGGIIREMKFPLVFYPPVGADYTERVFTINVLP